MLAFHEFCRDEPYEKAEEHYRLIIKNTVQLCLELKAFDMKSIYVTFAYLICSGRFSQEKKYYYDLYDRYYVYLNEAMTIMAGRGVCANDATMLYHLFEKAGIRANVIGGYLSDYFKKSYNPSIERDTKTHNEKTTPIKNRINTWINYKANTGTNHACTLGMDDKEAYLFDATNLVIYNLKKIQMAKVISGRGYFKPTIKYNTSISITDDLQRALEMESNPNLDVEKLFKKNIEHCENNIALIDDFYDENHHSINEIAKYVKKHARREIIK